MPLARKAAVICIAPTVTAWTADIMPIDTAIPSCVMVADNIMADAATLANTAASAMT